GGKLNSPWGLAWAPATGFGKASGALLVGNFGDGIINTYRQDHKGRWKWSGRLLTKDKKPLVIDGLWGIGFGNAGAAGAAPAGISSRDDELERDVVETDVEVRGAHREDLELAAGALLREGQTAADEDDAVLGALGARHGDDGRRAGVDRGVRRDAEDAVAGAADGHAAVALLHDGRAGRVVDEAVSTSGARGARGTGGAGRPWSTGGTWRPGRELPGLEGLLEQRAALDLGRRDRVVLELRSGDRAVHDRRTGDDRRRDGSPAQEHEQAQRRDDVGVGQPCA